MSANFLLYLYTKVSHGHLLNPRCSHEVVAISPKFDHLSDPKQLLWMPDEASFLPVLVGHQRLHRMNQACLFEQSRSLHSQHLCLRLYQHRYFQKLFVLLGFFLSEFVHQKLVHLVKLFIEF